MSREQMMHPADTFNWRIDQKVALLEDRQTYPDQPRELLVKETHMAWVFLTDRFAYKLKKPVRYDYLDFSTVEARHADCQREVQLNRRLAKDVYYGLVPLTYDDREGMQLGGTGEPIDWLVKMRRLPSDRVLQRLIEQGTLKRSDLQKVIRLLSRFYKDSPPIEMTAAEYRDRLRSSIRESHRELADPRYECPGRLVNEVHESLLDQLEADATVLGRRAEQGWIIDAHGDLRPEHIFLEREPVIIDCLEFNRDFRLLDSVSELSFLALECERLGVSEVNEVIWSTYGETTGDSVSERLIRFYKSMHACVRAKIAAWHLKEDGIPDPDKWVQKATHYLQLAREISLGR